MPPNSQNSYTCPKCKKQHLHFDFAVECCDADHILCPLSDLPADAEIGGGNTYSYGTVYTGSWEVFQNRHNKSATRVFPLPALVSKMISQLADARFAQGEEAAQKRIRTALGL